MFKPIRIARAYGASRYHIYCRWPVRGRLYFLFNPDRRMS
jgi:hypothetical protein